MADRKLTGYRHRLTIAALFAVAALLFDSVLFLHKQIGVIERFGWGGVDEGLWTIAAFAVGAACAGFLLAPLFGRSGSEGWVFAVIGWMLATPLGSLTGTIVLFAAALALLPGESLGVGSVGQVAEAATFVFSVAVVAPFIVIPVMAWWGVPVYLALGALVHMVSVQLRRIQ